MKTRLLIIIGIIGFTGLILSDASGFGIPPIQSTDEHFEFIDFQSTYQAGIPIQFILEKTRDSNCNSYNAKITDKDGNFIWGGGADILCDAISNPSSEILQTKIGYNENHPIIINKSGTYYLEVEFYDKFTKQEFKVRQNTAGGTIDRTVYPIPNPDPLDLWNSADVIIDGTIIDIEYTNSDKDNNIPNYHIKVNKYFKGVHQIGLVFAQNDLHVAYFEVNDTGLFYLKAGDTTGYSIQSHSVKTFGDCTARDLIEISPVLPNEGFPRSAPTKSESYFDPCLADYFSYDPDFFGGILNGISPLKQAKHVIPNDMIRCYGDLVKITKHDDSVACVKPETIPKLIQRDWVNPDKDGITVSFSFCGADGFDSDGNPNKSNSTHIWDGNYCKWQTIGDFESKPNLFLDIASIEENRIVLNPTDTCAHMSLRLLSTDKLEQYHARDKEVQFFEITETDLEELPVLDELIQATHHLDFTTNDDARAEMGLRELVDYEFFIMEKAINKYDDSQDDYFIKLDGNLDEKLADPKPQGFSNEFLSPQIVYADNVYVLSHTVFWVANEHETQSLSVHLQDSIDNDKKFIILTDEDMESIPKIKQAMEEIGTEFESIHARKGLPENPDWNEYREWFGQKKTEQFNLDETYVPGFAYNNEYYDLGFPIC